MGHGPLENSGPAGGPLPSLACFPAHDLLRIAPEHSLLLVFPLSCVTFPCFDSFSLECVSSALAICSVLIHLSRRVERLPLPLQPSIPSASGSLSHELFHAV